MPLDKVKENDAISIEDGLDITWNRLIKDAESEIKNCKDKISKLRKSIGFFKKQESLGLSFPSLKEKT
jgi:hypothetical protein